MSLSLRSLEDEKVQSDALRETRQRVRHVVGRERASMCVAERERERDGGVKGMGGAAAAPWTALAHSPPARNKNAITGGRK